MFPPSESFLAGPPSLQVRGLQAAITIEMQFRSKLFVIWVQCVHQPFYILRGSMTEAKTMHLEDYNCKTGKLASGFVKLGQVHGGKVASIFFTAADAFIIV